MSRAAAEVYRALPAKLAVQIPEQGSRRVLKAITDQLIHRDAGQLASRIARNWEHWRYRISLTEPLRDPTAIAIRLTRRGLECADVRCEDGHQLDLHAPCKACDQAAAHAARRQQGVVVDGESPTRPPSVGSRLETAFGSWPNDATTRSRWRTANPTTSAVEPTVDVRRYATLARRLLDAHSPAERDQVLAAHQAHARGA